MFQAFQAPGRFKHFSLMLALALVLPAAQADDKLAVNPLTGTPSEMDQKQRQFEALKLETAILEEQNKQAGLRGQKTNATPSVPPPPKPAPSRIKPQLQSTQGEVKAAPVPVPAGPRLVGIMWLGNKRLAVINTGAGEVIQATEGQAVAGRTIEDITDHSARFGGQLIEVAAHPGVASNRDKQPVGQPVGIQNYSTGNANATSSTMPLAGSATSLVLPQGTPGNFKP